MQMPLANKTKGKIIAENARFARTFLGKFKGLMFARGSKFNHALVFELGNETRMGASIHMLFVFFPIDAIYLDAKKRVVDVVRALKPFALNYTPKKPAKWFVELPAGWAKGTEIGDEIAW